MASDYPTFIFAFLVLAGGTIGYLKRGSLPSLIAGVVFSGIIAFGATQTSVNPKNIWVVLVASVALASVMGSKFFKGGKFMPAGLVFVLSVMNICRHLYRYSQ